jgi:hypothetical protein
VTFLQGRRPNLLAAALAAMLPGMGGPAPIASCAAFEKLGYVTPAPRRLRSDPVIVGHLRLAARNKRERRNRRRLSEVAAGGWRR